MCICKRTTTTTSIRQRDMDRLVKWPLEHTYRLFVVLRQQSDTPRSCGSRNDVHRRSALQEKHHTMFSKHLYGTVEE